MPIRYGFDIAAFVIHDTRLSKLCAECMALFPANIHDYHFILSNCYSHSIFTYPSPQNRPQHTHTRINTHTHTHKYTHTHINTHTHT